MPHLRACHTSSPLMHIERILLHPLYLRLPCMPACTVSILSLLQLVCALLLSIEIALQKADIILASGHQRRGLGFLPLSFILYGALVRCPAYKLSSRVTTKHRWTHCGTRRRAFMLPRPLRMRYSAKCFNHFAPSDGTDDIFLEEEKILVTPEPATSTLFLDFLSDSRKDLEKALFMILCGAQRSSTSQVQVTIYNLSISAKHHHCEGPV